MKDCSLSKGLVLVLVFSRCWVFSKQQTSTTTSTYPQRLHGMERDPFVENAPLVIAIACRDGVAIVAATEPTSVLLSSSTATTSSSAVQNHQQLSKNLGIVDSEPLMYYNANEIRKLLRTNPTTNTTTTIDDDDDDDTGYPFLDLPDTFAGPYRIQSVTSDNHRSSTFFVSCGWKVDGYIQLRNAARDIVNSERYTFGMVDDEEISIPLLANQISMYMAQCAISERVPCLDYAKFQVLLHKP